MKAYNAWLSAKDGQMICRLSRPSYSFAKKSDKMVYIESIFGIDFSADDWEVEKKKHKLTFGDARVDGTINDETITNVIKQYGSERPKKFTQVTLEWEEE